jgi:hypothetical protein
MTKDLEKYFTGIGEVSGFKFRQIRSTSAGFIYEVINDNKIYYEVFKKVLVAVCLNFEKRVYSEKDYKIIYPKAKDFGLWAWTYNDALDAYDKLESI